MKYCDDYAALLDLYVDGELSPEEMSRVRDHLDCCPGCQAYVDDALAIRAAFPDAEDVEVPADFADGVMARIQSEAVSRAEATPKKKQPTPWRKVLPTLAACCALVILLRSVPGMFSGRKEEAPAMAAPAMTTESAAEEKAVAAAEESVAMMDRQMAAGSDTAAVEVDNSIAITEDVSPAECAEPQEAEKAAGPYAYTDLFRAVYASVLTLPPEGAELMAAYTPVSEDGTEIRYELTAQEAEALLVQLETASFSYQSEEGIEPTTDLVLVILSK